jgi:hypothetical protein
MNYPEFSKTENSGFFYAKKRLFNDLRTPVEGRSQ